MSEPDALTLGAPPERIPLSGGDEYDGLTPCSIRALTWRAGERKRIKRGPVNRRYFLAALPLVPAALVAVPSLRFWSRPPNDRMPRRLSMDVHDPRNASGC